MVSGMLLSCKASSSAVHVEPGTFSALMDLYERNYIQMRRLVPWLPARQGSRVSRVRDGLDLYLRILERHRYTTDLVLTYRFQRAGGTLLEPDLQVRVYHDARVAEVLTAHLRHWPHFDTMRLDSDGDSQVYARWRVNRFLYKWLHYCLYQGHRFG